MTKHSSKGELSYMNAVEQARALEFSNSGRVFVYTIFALVALFIIWASVFQIDELTKGGGQVIPTTEMQIVQSLEGGILEELFVKEGDRVEKGDVLLRISDVAFASEARGGQARLLALQLRRLRLRAEIDGAYLSFSPDVIAQNKALADNELALYTSRQEELTNTLAIFEGRRKKSLANKAETQALIDKEKKAVALLNQEINVAEKMVARQAMSKVELIRLRRSANEIDGRLNVAQEKLIGLDAEIKALALEAEQKRDSFRTESLDELGKVETDIAALSESLKSIGDVVDRAALRAPVTGIVNTLAINTIGGVIEPARPLVEIVPIGDDLKVSARISPNDIAFIQQGQAVKVRISAYDPQRYGILEGKVSRIGASTVSDGDGNIFFEIEVRTENNYLGSAENPLPITPGMLAEIDIITGRKSILSYLLRPVLRLKDRAFRER